MRLMGMAVLIGGLLALAGPARACSFNQQAASDPQTQQQTAQASQPATATQ